MLARQFILSRKKRKRLGLGYACDDGRADNFGVDNSMITQELLNQEDAPEMFRKVAFAMFGVEENPDKYQHLNPTDDIFSPREETLNEHDLTRKEIIQQERQEPFK